MHLPSEGGSGVLILSASSGLASEAVSYRESESCQNENTNTVN